MSEPEDDALDERTRRLLRAVPEWGEAEAEIDDGALRAARDAGFDGEAHAAVAGQLAEAREGRRLLAALAEAEADPAVAMSVARAMARHQARRRRPALIGGGVLLALAAAVLVFVLAQPPAPRWQLDGPFGGVAETRGDETPSDTFAPTSRLRLFARPATPIEGPPPTCTATVAPADGGPSRAIDAAHLTVAPNGVCRLDAPIAALAPTAGRWRLALVIGAAALTTTFTVTPQKED